MDGRRAADERKERARLRYPLQTTREFSVAIQERAHALENSGRASACPANLSVVSSPEY
jgi:hypothetical protein